MKMAESVFAVRARGSTIGRELRGGLVTFVTMSYIVVLTPLILGSLVASDPEAKRDVLGAVLPVPQVAAATALVAGVMTLLFVVVANYPFAIATGLGINTLVAVTIAPQVSWPEAMVWVPNTSSIAVTCGIAVPAHLRRCDLLGGLIHEYAQVA